MHNSECYFDYNLGPATRLSARYSSARFDLHKEFSMPWRLPSHAHTPPTQKASTVSIRGPSSVETLMRFTPPAYCRSSILASFFAKPVHGHCVLFERWLFEQGAEAPHPQIECRQVGSWLCPLSCHALVFICNINLLSGLHLCFSYIGKGLAIIR